MIPFNKKNRRVMVLFIKCDVNCIIRAICRNYYYHHILLL